MDLDQAFEERLQEIDAYLSLLEALERQVRTGPPVIGGAPITAQQQKILYSSVYLQLYNLVEATVTWCIDAVVAASCDGGKWKPADLGEKMHREWVRIMARTHTDMSPGTRLDTAVAFCTKIIESKPIEQWSIERGGGGNWDVHAIQDMTERIGCDVQLSNATLKAVKRFVKDDMGPIELVKSLRNQLAHGSISFEQCGEGVTSSDLKAIRDVTDAYLREVIRAFRSFIDNHHFIVQHKRPGVPGGGL